MKHNLKMGDIVQVRTNGGWKDRIFVKYAKDGGIICVAQTYEPEYFAGEGFNIHIWEFNNWRLKQEPQYIPFDYTDADILLGKSIKSNQKNELYLITEIYQNEIRCGNNSYNLINLFENCTFLDGSICGKLSKENEK